MDARACGVTKVVLRFRSQLAAKTKIIGHYHGCSYEALGKAYPAELTSLEDKIDEVVGTYRWLK
jgi:hypothetical protein